MNSIQVTFEFQVVELVKIPERGSLIDLLDSVALYSKLDIDYWIAITSGEVGGNWFFNTKPMKDSISGKRLWVITSKGWERQFSPPSLFVHTIAIRVGNLYPYVRTLYSLV